ncbi:hypothetical protein ACFJEF_33050, partial [Streptomyces sp. Sce081]
MQPPVDTKRSVLGPPRAGGCGLPVTGGCDGFTVDGDGLTADGDGDGIGVADGDRGDGGGAVVRGSAKGAPLAADPGRSRVSSPPGHSAQPPRSTAAAPQASTAVFAPAAPPAAACPEA